MRLFQAISLAGLAGIVSAQANITVNAPVNAFYGQTVQVSWTGGTSPYNVSVVDTDNARTTVQTLNSTSATSEQWCVNIDLDQDTTYLLRVVDSTGTEGLSDGFFIAQPADDQKGCPGQCFCSE